MPERSPMKGWKRFLYALFLGPFFLILHFRENRERYPAARYFAWASLLWMVCFVWLLFGSDVGPGLVRTGYILGFLAVTIPAGVYCWVLDARSRPEGAGESGTGGWSLTRAVAWMLVMGTLFAGINNLVQAVYFWLFGERIAVYFSNETNLFRLWFVIGLFYGFIYGIRRRTGYIDRSLGTLLSAIGAISIFIAVYSGLVLVLVIYPLQRLGPIAYRLHPADFIFYGLLFGVAAISAPFLLKASARRTFPKAAVLLAAGIPLILLHLIAASGYGIPLTLTVASVLEEGGDLPAARALYARAIPHIRYESLLASLHHRQGVLHVLDRNHAAALGKFKKVLTDYSEPYDVYRKARRYVDSFEEDAGPDRAEGRILPVRHRSFEQAASCFPNSLSVVLSFYEGAPVDVRGMSYAIKEGFGKGTFVWKAESFLGRHGYRLITTLWQDADTLVALLDAGYPVLVYTPGHVYTVYGYDGPMEIFFTYDTARSNRWNDKPFAALQSDWMAGGFQMSVVVRREEADAFSDRFPGVVRYAESYRLWQKTLITAHYEGRDAYWKDYNPYRVAETLGLDRLKIGADDLLSESYSPLPWKEDHWTGEILAILDRPWATRWPVVERHLLYLLRARQPERALDFARRYESHLSEEATAPFSRLLELKLAAAAMVGDDADIRSLSEKLIGITDNNEYGSYWGHYFKARRLMARGDLKAAASLLLPVLDEFYISGYGDSDVFPAILDTLNRIHQRDASVIDPDKMSRIEVARVHFASWGAESSSPFSAHKSRLRTGGQSGGIPAARGTSSLFY